MNERSGAEIAARELYPVGYLEQSKCFGINCYSDVHSGYLTGDYLFNYVQCSLFVILRISWLVDFLTIVQLY